VAVGTAAIDCSFTFAVVLAGYPSECITGADLIEAHKITVHSSVDTAEVLVLEVGTAAAQELIA